MTIEDLRNRFWTAWDNCLDSPNSYTAPFVHYKDLWEEFLPDIILFAKEYNPESKESDNIELKNILSEILKEPHGCPMCDSGKLRDPNKSHWDNCPYLKATKHLAK